MLRTCKDIKNATLHVYRVNYITVILLLRFSPLLLTSSQTLPPTPITITLTPPHPCHHHSPPHPQSGDGVVDSSVPGVLYPQQVLARLHTQVFALLKRRLHQEAVLPFVDVLALLDNAEHGLVHSPHGRILHPVVSGKLQRVWMM